MIPFNKPYLTGKGVGKFMINECMKIWPTAFSKVKIDNEASMKLFEACGFTKKYYILTKD
jgi:RimJ/RimL family protein N-acetyltransferase